MVAMVASASWSWNSAAMCSSKTVPRSIVGCVGMTYLPLDDRRTYCRNIWLMCSIQNRDGVGRRAQAYLPTFNNAARLIHEYRLPVLAQGALAGVRWPAYGSRRAVEAS